MSSTDPNELAEPLGTLVRYALWRARREGKSLKLVSGRRSNEQQIALRKAHCGPSDYDIWHKPSSQCRPPTARPIGRGAKGSKHLRGEAADMGGSKDWMAKILRGYGVSRPVRGEDWHFEVTGSRDPNGTLKAVAVAMKMQGAEQADFDVVFVGNSATAQKAADESTAFGSLRFKLPSVGGFAGDLVGAVPGVSEVGAVSGFVGGIDWRRVALGASGLVVLLFGLVVLGFDVFSTQAVQRSPVGQVAKSIGKS